MQTIDLEQAKNLIIAVEKEAGQILLENIDRIKNVRQKGARDLTTDLDAKVEHMIVGVIKKNYPTHSIVAEENESLNQNSDYVWVVDPIDGTMNYIHGHPPYRVGVGLLYKGDPVLSVLYGPTRDSLYTAIKGNGAELNGQPIQVTDHESLMESLVMTHFSSHKLPRLQTIVALEGIFNHSMQIRVLGSGLAAACYIADGQYDVFFNIKTKPWDFIPALCLIEEAGGKATNIYGEKVGLDTTSILITNGRVHQKMLELLKNV